MTTVLPGSTPVAKHFSQREEPMLVVVRGPLADRFAMDWAAGRA